MARGRIQSCSGADRNRRPGDSAHCGGGDVGLLLARGVERASGASAGDIMEILVILVPLALALGLPGLLAFLWSLRSGQYDDLEGAAWPAITDEERDGTRHSAPRY